VEFDCQLLQAIDNKKFFATQRIKLTPQTLEWFKSQGRGYQAMIDSVLTSYVEHQEKYSNVPKLKE
jgi:uncharacterized protein (DUF4415 family)